MIEYVTPDLMTFGDFRPHWGTEYPSYSSDRDLLWANHLTEALREIKHRAIVVPFDLEVHGAESRVPQESYDTIVEPEPDMDSVAYWHMDCGASPDMQDPIHMQWLVVWATVRPTEIRRLDNDELFIGEPFQMVAFRNGVHVHRIPPMTPTEATQRWFCRARLYHRGMNADEYQRTRYKLNQEVG